MKLKYLEQAPSAKAERVLIMFHGVGSDARDMMSLAAYLAPQLPKVHIISVQGPQGYDMAHVGYQWFSLSNRLVPVLQKEIAVSVPIVAEFITSKLSAMGLEAKDAILLGFSQGAMLATHLAITTGLKFAGIVAIAGAVIPALEPVENNTEVCMIHGEDDDIVLAESMEQGAAYLRKAGLKVQTHLIPLLAHSIDLRCINITINFINSLHGIGESR